MGKTKGGQDQGWEVGMAGVGGLVGRKWRQLYLNNNKNKIKKLQYIHALEYYLAIKIEQNLIICDNMDGPREYNAKLNKSDRERKIPCFTYMWNLKNKINKIEIDS